MKKLTNKRGLGLSSSKGFTLIEVVLVLAIGGLIFLLAFIAFQQVSANRRDTQRRSDAGRIVAEVQNYLSNNNITASPTTVFGFGSGPSTSPKDACVTDADKFMVVLKTGMCNSANEFKDPSGSNYRVVSLADTTNNVGNYPITTGDMLFVVLDCKGVAGGYSVRMKLEKGSVCRDS